MNHPGLIPLSAVNIFKAQIVFKQTPGLIAASMRKDTRTG